MVACVFAACDVNCIDCADLTTCRTCGAGYYLQQGVCLGQCKYTQVSRTNSNKQWKIQWNLGIRDTQRTVQNCPEF